MIPDGVVELCHVRMRWRGDWYNAVVLQFNGEFGIMSNPDGTGNWIPLDWADEVQVVSPPVRQETDLAPFSLDFWENVSTWTDLDHVPEDEVTGTTGDHCC